MNVINYSFNNEIGNYIKTKRTYQSAFDTYHFSRRLPAILKEKEFHLSKTGINKIFCGQWLDDNSVILGTKCNKLVVLDTNTNKSHVMNPLKSHIRSPNLPNNCGIHSISINPSRTLLATGSDNVNDIAIYRLPSLEPLCVGWSAHTNWIFDTVWIDDTHVVSGAGDSKLALWTIDNHYNSNNNNNNNNNISNNSNIFNKSDNNNNNNNTKNNNSYDSSNESLLNKAFYEYPSSLETNNSNSIEASDYESYNSSSHAISSNNDMISEEDEEQSNYYDINDDDDDDSYYENDLYDDNYEPIEFQKRRRIDAFGKYQIPKTQYKFKNPTKVITCKRGKRIRAITYNKKKNEIAAIAMNASFHTFDSERFVQNYAKKLSLQKENVCLTVNSDNNIYAIGSASHVQLLIADNARALLPPIFIKKDIGIRSLNFRNHILSIGTGLGTVLFYDLRTLQFLHKSNDDKFKLQSSAGWILQNENYYDYLSYSSSMDRSHAIYTHCYDPSGTKILTAGGPLTVGLHGHYAAVWQ